MNPFTDIRLDNDIGPLIKQSTGTNASNQVTRQPQEEREPIGQILRKALYGVKHAPQTWNKRIHNFSCNKIL